LKTKKGKIQYIISQKQAEDALKENEERLRQIEEETQKLRMFVEQTSDWVIITNRDGNIEYVNNAAEAITGYKKEELIGKNPRVFKSEMHDAGFYKRMWDALSSGNPFVDIFINRNKKGEVFYIHQTIRPLKDKNGNITHFVATGKDVTQLKAMEEKLNYLAYNDILTGIPNRNFFVERLNREIARSEYREKLFAVAVINIDRFKYINDTFGPAFGDHILKMVAERLSGTLRKGDVVARFGSDEFGIVFVDIRRSEDTARVFEKIRRDFLQPIRFKDEEIMVALSAGVSFYPSDGKSADELIKNANIGLTKAKKQGGNVIQFYTLEMNKRLSELAQMERLLLKAMKENEFQVHYQPYWDINTKNTVGMEALIRWNNKELGSVPPSRFIPVLEETKMIIDVGAWVLKESCRQIKEWVDKGYKVVPVSVNLSLIQFKQKDLGEMITRMAQECGIGPEFITLEITESALMQDMEFTNLILNKLKGVGFSISIDDFGTGYSSLSYLKKLPVDNLKIDISFIREIANDPDTASIVTAIIGMAHTMNLKTIAEGVETEEQWKILRLLRCDLAQGFYHSKPMPAKEVERFIA
ncbi:MAG: EAL domain-containing protein, partial [Nitrospirae bacterium]|nr:EAL domain-containing protein [Nitrospirota bacterium]